MAGLLLTSLAVLADEKPADKGETAVLSIEEFIERGARQDTEFEQILIDELTLQYQKALQLPAGDIILSVKQQHNFFLNQDREEGQTEVSLSKLFPYTGTDVEAAYEAVPATLTEKNASEFSFSLAQPIAENAFGHSTRLLDKIVGLEVDVARHQIVEAYEDYMAAIMAAYYEWYGNYESLLIAQSSYEQNLKLLDNIKERQRHQIAKPIDVNKIQLQVLAKKEALVEEEEAYQNSLNVIQRVIRYDKGEALVPSQPPAWDAVKDSFATEFGRFHASSRTFAVLRMLEERSSLQVARSADDLLPSINLLLGYEVQGEEHSIKNEKNLLYAGIEMEWPFPDTVNRAEHKIAKINEQRAELVTTNAYYRLYTSLLNLYLQIQRERELIAITDEKIELAKAVLEDETENYSFGRVTLNDYIQAVNVLDANRFSKITHEVELRRLLAEWARLTDRLVGEGKTREKP